MNKLERHLVKLLKKNNMIIQTCCEENNLIQYGFAKGECLSADIAKRLTGKDKFKKWKARKNNLCNCVEMVDIGTYNSCKHFCKYCYANYDEKQVLKNWQLHNLNSSLLIGTLTDDDIIKIRK